MYVCMYFFNSNHSYHKLLVSDPIGPFLNILEWFGQYDHWSIIVCFFVLFRNILTLIFFIFDLVR